MRKEKGKEEGFWFVVSRFSFFIPRFWLRFSLFNQKPETRNQKRATRNEKLTHLSKRPSGPPSSRAESAHNMPAVPPCQVAVRFQ